MIRPNKLSYTSSYDTAKVEFSYKHNVLTGKYKRKANRIYYKVAAVKIKNESSQDLEFGKDIVFTYDNGDPVEILENTRIIQRIKQLPGAYFLYLLLSPMNLTTSTGTGYYEKSTIFPIGLILGPALFIGNALHAGNSNKTFREEFMYYTLANKIIAAGQTEYGIIGFRSKSPESLKIKLQ